MSESATVAESEQQSISKFYYTVTGHNIILEPEIKTEIIEQQDIFPIPHSPDWCKGMISLRGKLIPVINLHKVLNDSEQDKSDWLLIMEKAPHSQIAISIDQLPKQQTFQGQSFEALDPNKFASWLVATTSIDNKILYEADHSILFEQLIQINEASQSDSVGSQSPNSDTSGNDA